jgi:hypothetical protein
VNGGGGGFWAGSLRDGGAGDDEGHGNQAMQMFVDKNVVGDFWDGWLSTGAWRRFRVSYWLELDLTTREPDESSGMA